MNFFFQCRHFTVSTCIFETFCKINYDAGKEFPLKKFRTKVSGIACVEWTLSLDVSECKKSILYTQKTAFE